VKVVENTVKMLENTAAEEDCSKFLRAEEGKEEKRKCQELQRQSATEQDKQNKREQHTCKQAEG
jgi:hypothetical protein